MAWRIQAVPLSFLPPGAQPGDLIRVEGLIELVDATEPDRVALSVRVTAIGDELATVEYDDAAFELVDAPNLARIH